MALREDMHLPPCQETGCSCRDPCSLFGRREVALKAVPFQEYGFVVLPYCVDEPIVQFDG